MTTLYEVKCTGLTPLLMNGDDVPWADAMERWKNDPANKKFSKAGDDRTPAFRWIGSLWHDGKVVGIPTDVISAALMGAASKVPVPGGKNGKTFKRQSQSGMTIQGSLSPLLVRGKPIKIADLDHLRSEMDFSKHEAAVAKHGFCLFVKRATVGTSKHIRVRPRFDEWVFTYIAEVWDEQITAQQIVSIAEIAGAAEGIGNWRPSAPKKPGSYGRYSVEVKAL